MPKKDGRPRHQQIAAELRALIMSGDLAPGTRLPTTQQLMAQYAVTSQTVQRTLNVLKDENFIVGRAGVGVYVRDEPSLAITPASYMTPAARDEAYPWMTEAAKRSQRGAIRLLGVSEVAPPAAVAEALGLDDGEAVSLRHQMLLLDDRPAELAWIYHPLSIAQGTPLMDRKRIPGGSPRLLAELGHPPRQWVDRLSSRLPTTEELETLELPDDVPVLRTLRVVYTDETRPIEVQVLVKGGHLYELMYRQDVD
ncbi:GntR family transcriptional regulator [Streptosporangium pseudovulgare]|uniref:GntR family transcriptional regulator n=1 Tax=Streptosporangium pseudovulgare TaxID=35765 RepID=A0ABQ2QXJ0_9ACTN|nr:GntR family transcriptional regulator [Streptosporangium pseudovulgare]GGP97376.1 GntR family transcriptional regulator [Streptosporangium pseudovulgare]